MNNIRRLLVFLVLPCLCIKAQDSLLRASGADLNSTIEQRDSLQTELNQLLQLKEYHLAIIPTIKLIDQSLEDEDGNKAHYYRFRLAKLYYYLGWFNNALDNLEYCQVYYRQNQNNIEYVRTCHMLAMVNLRLNNLEMANYFFGQTELEKPTINNPLLKFEHALLEIKLHKNKDDSLTEFKLLNVIKFARENSLTDLSYESNNTLGDLYNEKGKIILACAAYEKALNICLSQHYLFEIGQLDLKIHECLTEQEHYKEANTRLLHYISVSDTLSKIKQNELLSKSIEKYENKTFREGKIELAQDKRLFELKSRRSNFTLIGLLSGIAFILLAVFLIVLFYQQKLSASDIILKQSEQINTQKIKELKQSIALNNLESMIKGQEEERERIAKDLHDSLGGLLSTIKLRYDNLIYEMSGIHKTSEQQRVHDLIDEACSEIRSIAHDLTPGALEELGLIEAIQDMLNRYDKSGQIITFQYYGFSEQTVLDSEISIYVYRIIQELVNNAFKHAEAKEILVQISLMEDQLEVIVEDDGKGYSESAIKKGMGLENIKSRVYYLKGELSVKSESGSGTSSYIVIPLKNS